jgi:hypothetical protein
MTGSHLLSPAVMLTLPTLQGASHASKEAFPDHLTHEVLAFLQRMSTIVGTLAFNQILPPDHCYLTLSKMVSFTLGRFLSLRACDRRDCI